MDDQLTNSYVSEVDSGPEKGINEVTAFLYLHNCHASVSKTVVEISDP